MSGFGIASEKVPTMKSLDSDKKPSGIPKTKDAVVEEKIDFSKVKVSLCLKNMLILKHFQSQISVQ